MGNPGLCETPSSADPRPRGLLPLPRAVEEIAARELARLEQKFDVTPTLEASRRLLDSLVLQHYYEDCDVAYRLRPDGVEVLAVGPEEIGALIRGMPESERLTIKIGQP